MRYIPTASVLAGSATGSAAGVGSTAASAGSESSAWDKHLESYDLTYEQELQLAQQEQSLWEQHRWFPWASHPQSSYLLRASCPSSWSDSWTLPSDQRTRSQVHRAWWKAFVRKACKVERVQLLQFVVDGRSWKNGKLVVRWGASEIIDFEWPWLAWPGACLQIMIMALTFWDPSLSGTRN